VRQCLRSSTSSLFIIITQITTTEIIQANLAYSVTCAGPSSEWWFHVIEVCKYTRSSSREGDSVLEDNRVVLISSTLGGVRATQQTSHELIYQTTQFVTEWMRYGASVVNDRGGYKFEGSPHNLYGWPVNARSPRCIAPISRSTINHALVL
jgi:hypothetical protein